MPVCGILGVEPVWRDEDVPTSYTVEQPSGPLASGILREAADLVSGDRAEAYGDASVMFAKIRDLWNAYLGASMTSQDVAMLLGLMKIARIKTGAPRRDSMVDGSAYIALAWEVREGDL